MIQHVTAWLEAYHDGELSARKLRQVETHLADCTTCQAELERLQGLSALLHASPAARRLTPPDRFVAQVGLRLPRHPEQSGWKRALEIGWRAIPVGLLGAWAFVQAVFLGSWVVWLALQAGLGSETLAQWLPATGASLHDGIGGTLRWVGTLGGGFMLNFGLLAVIGLLYASWLASWLARRRHAGETR